MLICLLFVVKTLKISHCIEKLDIKCDGSGAEKITTKFNSAGVYSITQLV